MTFDFDTAYWPRRHRNTCKLCDNLVSRHDDIGSAVGLHYKVHSMGTHNYCGARVRVASNLHLENWRDYLTGFDDEKVVEFLEFGFPIGFEGEVELQSSATNHLGARDYPSEVEDYLRKEGAAGHIIGPFQNNPFHVPIQCSPLNSVPKKDSIERRFILDLSFPKGASVNDGIPKHSYLGDWLKLVLPSVDMLVELVREKGPGCLLFKRDLRKAYRQIPVDPGDIHRLGFRWKGHLYCDRVLPMGLRSACQACQRVTNGVAFAFCKWGYSVVNYIDDFAGAEVRDRAPEAYHSLGVLLDDLGLDESKDKACSPSTSMSFLGVLFDTVDGTLSVTNERLKEILALLEVWKKKQVASKTEVQSLIGKLNFVAACVRPSRIFMSRLLSLLRSMKDDTTVQLNPEFKKDISWWSTFLPLYNGVSMIPFAEWGEPDVEVASDSCLVGCGVFSAGQFFHATFPDFIQSARLHISALELLSVMICVKLWGQQWKGSRLQVVCDNEAAVRVLNRGFSRDAFMQDCMREIAYFAALWEFELRAVHIPGVDNRIPDLLSRWDLDVKFSRAFYHHTREFRLIECEVSDDIFKFSNLW